MRAVKLHLSEILGRLRINQTELSQMTGIRTATINGLYHEMATSIKFEHIEKICDALGCTAADLIEYIPKDKL